MVTYYICFDYIRNVSLTLLWLTAIRLENGDHKFKITGWEFLVPSLQCYGRSEKYDIHPILQSHLAKTKKNRKFFIMKFICKLSGEALKLARKLDNEQIIELVDQYVKFCGLSVTCKSPDQIKLSRKPGRSNAGRAAANGQQTK